jgi:hypothetical protein
MEVRRTSNSEAIKNMLAELDKKEIRVGFFENSKYPDGTPIAYVAAIQEFGYGPIRPRPFMRPAEEANKGKWLKGIAAGVRGVIAGNVTLDHALEQVGMVAAGDVRKAIKAVTAPSLAESTVRARQRRKKGKKAVSRKPLVDTGQMLQAVNSAVVTT